MMGTVPPGAEEATCPREMADIGKAVWADMRQTSIAIDRTGSNFQVRCGVWNRTALQLGGPDQQIQS